MSITIKILEEINNYSLGCKIFELVQLNFFFTTIE